jgi:deoxyhypusine synthase
VSWGKVDPDRLPDAVVCYTDTTLSLPLVTAYALSRRKPRTPKRLFGRRQEILSRLIDEYRTSERNEAAQEAARHGESHTRGVTLDRDR